MILQWIKLILIKILIWFSKSVFFVLQMEIEKKKVKKLTEQKKAVDTRLDQEMNRNTELQKEMYR